MEKPAGAVEPVEVEKPAGAVEPVEVEKPVEAGEACNGMEAYNGGKH